MKTRGFTLLELLATLTIIAIIGAIVVPSYLASQKRARTDAAIARAAVLDISKSNYLEAKGTDAWDAWDTIETANAGNDDAMNDAKYQALKSFLSSSAEAILGVGVGSSNEYTPKGYKYELNGLADSTTVIDLDTGAIVAGIGGSDGVRVKITRSTFEQDGTTPAPEVGGVTSGAGLYKLQSTATLVAYPRLGFEFLNWELGGSTVGGANQLNIGPFASTNTLTYDASFRRLPPGTYNLIVNVNPSSGGSVSINPNKVSYTSGESVTLTATPAVGYTFDRWFGTGISSTSNPLINVVMDQNRQVYANFVPPTFNVVMQAPDLVGAGVTTPSAGTTNKVLQGSSMSISSIPNLGYDFSQWTGLPAGAPVNTASQIITVNNNLTIKPVYAAAPTYSLTVNVSPAASGTAIIGTDTNTTSVNNMVKGQSTNVSAFPGAGKLFDKWILASGNGSLSDLASPTTTFTMHPSAPAANNVVTAQFKDNQLASEVITVPPGMSYIKTTSNLASVGLTTPNGPFSPGSQVPLTAQVSANFPNYRFIRWAKKPDTNTTISTAATFNVTAPAVGVIDEYIAYFDLGVNKFISEIPTTPYAPYNSILNPARDKIYSAVGLDGIIVQDVTNTNAANITQLCQLKFRANTTCMATREDLGLIPGSPQKWIVTGSTAAGEGICFYEPPAYLKYNTADSTNVTNPAILNANNVTFATRDLAFNRANDATSGTILYAVSSGQVAQFNFYPAANGEKDHWRKDFFLNIPAPEIAKSVAVQPNTGNVYILCFNSGFNRHFVWCLNNKANVSLGRTQVWSWPAGQQFNLIRFNPANTSELHAIRGGAGYTTTNEISVVLVNGANPIPTETKRYSYTQAGTGDPTQMVFNSAGDKVIISGVTSTASLAIPGGNATFVGAQNTPGGPYLTYGAAESSYGYPIGMMRNPLTGEIWSIPGPGASTLGHNGYGLRYMLDGNGVIDTSSVKRAMIDARGLAFDKTGTYLYVTDYPYNTNHALGKLAVFDLVGSGNLKGWQSSVFLGTAWGIGLDKEFSPSNFNDRWYVATDSTPSGNQKFGIIPFVTVGDPFSMNLGSVINTHDWTPANIFVNNQTDRLWAVQFNGNEVAAFDLANTNSYPRLSAFTLGSGGTGAVGITTPSDGNELFVTFSGSGVTPKVGVYDPASGQQKRSLVFPYTGSTELQGVYYDDPATNIFISDHGDKRILKFGP